MKRASFYLLMLLILLLLAFGAYYGVFKMMDNRARDYSRKYNPPDYEEYDYLTTRQVMNLGWAQKKDDHPQSSYLNYTKEKAPGVYRIGVFGGSFTEGSETCNGGDFPTQLNEILNAYSDDSFEVINFGVSGYGIHQSYLLYQYLGRQYHLDEVVFNPYRMHIERDNSFLLYFLYEPLHARYILDGDSLKQIEIPGTDRAKAVKQYHSFFQPEQYVKYDRKVPNYLKPILRNGDNPKYYLDTLSSEDEALQTYYRMFSQINKEVPLTVLFNDLEMDWKWMNEQGIKTYIIPTQEMKQQLDPSFYRAPNGHPSYLMNNLIADILSKAWAKNYTFPERYVADVLAPETKGNGELEVLIAGQKTGAFFSKANDPFYSEEVKLTADNYLWLNGFMGFATMVPLNVEPDTQIANIVQHYNDTVYTYPIGLITKYSDGIWYIRQNRDSLPWLHIGYQDQVFSGFCDLITDEPPSNLTLQIGSNEISLTDGINHIGAYALDTSAVYYYRLKCADRLENLCPLDTINGVPVFNCPVQFRFK